MANPKGSKPVGRKGAVKQRTPATRRAACSLRFEGARLDGIYDVLDAVAWLDYPNVSQVAVFAGADPRTVGKLVKNATTIGLICSVDGSRLSLLLPYPHKGSPEAKRTVVREALVRMPLLQTVRQFLQIGEPLDAALRKAAVVQHVENYDPQALTPLLEWAKQLDALTPGLNIEDLLEEATEAKEERHREVDQQPVVFLSHSSLDKPFIRRLASDLTAEGIMVWLDEQNIRVGDSIPERIAQGLAQSDYFIIALSEHSTGSDWVKHELNNALVAEISRREISILPIKIGDCEIPPAIRDKKYADFTKGYKSGLQEVLAAINLTRGR